MFLLTLIRLCNLALIYCQIPLQGDNSKLQHIQAPLLEFERQKLVKQFGKTVPPVEEEGGEETTTIDYM